MFAVERLEVVSMEEAAVSLSEQEVFESLEQILVSLLLMSWLMWKT